MLERLRRVAGATVWAHDGVRPEDYRYRGLYRFVLPLTDVLFLYFGAVGWHNGIRSVAQAAGPEAQTWWSGAIALFSFVALVGVAFPRLWPVEAFGKIWLIVFVSQYVFLILGRGVLDEKVTATAGLIIILVLLPIWRVADLGFVWWQERRRRRIGGHG